MEPHNGAGGMLPVYAVRLFSFAFRGLDGAITFVNATCGMDGKEAAEYAVAFRAGLLVALGTLATFPNRFPIAMEAAKMAAPAVRVMPYSYRPGGPV